MIVLDTHAWLWWINQSPELSLTWRMYIEQAEQVSVSAISLFEVSWLELHGRITLSCPRLEWFDKALSGSQITLMPISPEIADRAVSLPEYHSDPQDRIIIATALVHHAKLLSVDSKFKFYTELGDTLIQ